MTVYGSKIFSPNPPLKSSPDVDPALQVAVHQNVQQDSFVYVHCYLQNQWHDALIRIWKTSFLIDQTSGAKSQLIHVENISIAPVWTLIADNSAHHFLLIFSGLPKACIQFDLVEEISQPGGFNVTQIPRNRQDVYHIEV